MSKDKSIETLKRVLNYIAAYRWAVCLSLLLALVTVAFTLYIPILTGKAVDEIVSQGNVDFSALISIIKKDHHGNGSYRHQPVAYEPY